ncbi:hypothetical protein MASR2M8_08860 [Opitutaceae bacterium]
MNAPGSEVTLKSEAGFSLLEVVIATGLCAGAISAVLAMLPPLLAAMAESQQRATALRIASALDAQWRAAPWSDVTAVVDSGETWYADALGSRLGTGTDPIWQTYGATAAERDGRKRFELVAMRDTRLSGPAVLAYVVVVRWPAYTGDGRRIADPSLQSRLILHASRTR